VIKQCLQDESGQYSSARVFALLTLLALFATIAAGAVFAVLGKKDATKYCSDTALMLAGTASLKTAASQAKAAVVGKAKAASAPKEPVKGVPT